MAIVSTGYAGTVNDVQWAQMSCFFGQDFGVLNPNDLAVTQQSGAKTFNVAAGTFYGRGIMDISDSTVNVAPTVPVSGGRWFLIVARRIWATKVTSFLAVAGPTTSATPPTSKPANYPTLQRNPGVQDDQPLAWVWVNASNTTTVIFDQRIFSDGRVANFNAIPPVGFLTRGSQLTVEPVRMIVVDNGTAWLPVTMRVSGTTAQRIEATNAGIVAEGMEWRDTTANSDYVRSGGYWLGSSAVLNVASAALASAAWTVLSNPAMWSVAAQMNAAGDWANGVVIPEDGDYLIAGSILVAANIPIYYGVKRNNTAASAAGLVAGAQTTGFSNNTLVSFAREMRLVAGDVLTPVGFTSGSAGPYGITPAGSGFSVARIR